MAVFSIVHGNPFRYELDATPSYDAVFDLPSDVFNFAADTRLAMQMMTFGWGVSYTKWYGNFGKVHDPDNLLQNQPFMALLAVGMIFSFLPYGMVTVGPYFSPWTAPVAFVLDAYNIYQYSS